MEASCVAPQGIWRSTQLVTADTATQRKEVTRADFKARLSWLKTASV